MYEEINYFYAVSFVSDNCFTHFSVLVPYTAKDEVFESIICHKPNFKSEILFILIKRKYC